MVLVAVSAGVWVTIVGLISEWCLRTAGRDKHRPHHTAEDIVAHLHLNSVSK